MKCWLAMGLLLLFGTAVLAQDKCTALLLSGGMELDGKVAKLLKDEGIGVVQRGLADPISLEQLKCFEFVIIPDFAGAMVPNFIPAWGTINYLNLQKNLAALQQYVREGGGLFFSPLMAGGGAEVTEGAEGLLAPWDAHLVTGQVRDNAHAAAKIPYAWTTAIAKSPLTAGVSKLWYPTNQLRWDDAYATVPFNLEDKAWQVLVRAMPGSVGAKGLQYTTWLPLPGVKDSPIAAVRPVEKGRVALCGIAPFYTFSHAYSLDDRGWVGESNTGLIDGIVLEKGDESADAPSDGWTLLANVFHWLAEGGRAAGFGNYTKEKFAALPAPKSEPFPAWMSWNAGNGAVPVKVLVGARSSASNGTATVAEMAAAARKAGYGVLAMTETFEKMDPAAWPAFVKACDAATGDDLIVMPGLDIADIFGNRFLVLGTRIYPEKFMLDETGKAMKQAQYLSLGFGTHFTIIARPSTTPMPHQLYKFFAGIAVSTWRGGKLVDDGLLAYQWQVNNASMPLPVAVHEVFSPADVALAAGDGPQQTYVLADTPRNAAWYLRPGMAHHWETPSLFLVSGGPMVRTLNGGRIVADDDVPITEVRAISQHVPVRRWTPKEPTVDLTFNLPPNQYYPLFFHLTDAKGRTAITPIVRLQWAPGYLYRCSDRQNFFGYAVNYTGTILPQVDITLPAFGTKEGQGFWPDQSGSRRGENIAPLIEFPFASHAVTITDANIDQRYWNAQWEDVVFDGKASQGTARTRVYEAKVRYYDYHYEGFQEFTRTSTRPMMVVQADVRLRIPVAPEGDIFPGITGVKASPEYEYTDANGEVQAGKLTKGYLDLPVGGRVEEFVALTPGWRVLANGRIGFAAPAWTAGALPAGTSWGGCFVMLPPAKIKEMRVLMGLTGKPPYGLTVTRGTLTSLCYVAMLEAANGGVEGTVKPAPSPAAQKPTDPAVKDEIPADAPVPAMTYPLPLTITGLNGNWDTRVWREDDSLTAFAVFEGNGYARLDVTKGGRFFAGEIITAKNAPALRLTVVKWDADGITVEAHNPTAAPLEATLETTPAIPGRYHLQQPVTVPPGATVMVEGKK
jgi:hypothetical protein